MHTPLFGVQKNDTALPTGIVDHPGACDQDRRSIESLSDTRGLNHFEGALFSVSHVSKIIPV
jgi:hypothetical protein